MQLDARQRAMLQEMGVTVWLPASADSVEVAPRPLAPVPLVSPVSPPPAATVQPLAPASTLEQTSAMANTVLASVAVLGWPALVSAAGSCRACELCMVRRHSSLLAPSEPALPCDWMVVGDPPDADEDRSGSPFAGADGVLLDNMLRAVGLQRVNVRPVDAANAPQSAVPQDPAQRAYVTNVVKCRPDHGRIARPDELQQCSAFLQREIALVQPKIILALGRFAIQLLLGETPALAEQPLGRVRGSVYSYQGVAVVPLYHPRALLRHAADKAKAWQDLCLAADTVQGMGTASEAGSDTRPNAGPDTGAGAG